MHIDTFLTDMPCTHMETDVGRIPSAAQAFESSSGIPFLSLPNMGGIVREREEECGRQWNPLVMSELWNSEPHAAWKFTGRNVGNVRITEMLFSATSW